MGRGRQATALSKVTVPRERSLAIDEARERLYKLVKELASLTHASRSFLDHAVEIGPRGKGGALLVPTVDIAAMLEQMEALEDRIEVLEDEIEDLTLAQIIEERLETPKDQRLTLEE